ncbi:RidA family protein [Microbacterium capsulatum]|uniref:RidA family protein n=1 Tax=Microbacterium capsulatum TaxID=3041921 RepID=A0ABU0XKE9_9MICO|nr:RidA family protein [Microbacterium sp. ASV81]MDQ4215612.1 RidA family protein [Microbacterium sp. ASV81]
MTAEPNLGTYGSARVANGIVFTSGKIGLDEDGRRPEEFSDEVRAAIADLDKTLREHGSDLTALLQVHCILSDMDRFAEFDAVYRELIPAPVPPRFTHGGDLVQDFRFEIVAVAAVRS